jgi:NADH-quinone oxidoreductase subunit J
MVAWRFSTKKSPDGMEQKGTKMQFLFADAETGPALTTFLRENWLLLMPPVLGFAAIYLLLPKARRAKPIWGGVLAALAMILGAAVLVRTDAAPVEAILFYAFAGFAVAAGVMMITQSNPVHAALSFALVVLSTCGLFLLLAAPFLMAATIIVYAGAIVVTFLFVIMLAQQEGVSNADQRSREPFLASLAGCVLLAALLCVLQKNYRLPAAESEMLDSMARDLAALKDAKDDADIKSVLGDPKKVEAGQRTRPLVINLQKHFADPKIVDDSENLNQAWNRMKVDEVKKNAALLHAAVTLSRNRHGSLALGDVPAKRTPGHFAPGELPASNVAALGRTLFTDYLVPVELAATLLLVATIGAIAIAGRKSEGLR